MLQLYLFRKLHPDEVIVHCLYVSTGHSLEEFLNHLAMSLPYNACSAVSACDRPLLGLRALTLGGILHCRDVPLLVAIDWSVSEGSTNYRFLWD